MVILALALIALLGISAVLIRATGIRPAFLRLTGVGAGAGSLTGVRPAVLLASLRASRVRRIRVLGL